MYGILTTSGQEGYEDQAYFFKGSKYARLASSRKDDITWAPDPMGGIR